MNPNRRSVLGKSGIEYTDYYLNTYESCSHGCLYPCYSRLLKMRSYEEWIKPKPVLNAVELLKNDIDRLKEKPKDIMISTSTDPYQPINDRYQLTRKCIKVLIKHGLPFSIRPKNAGVVHNLDLLGDYPHAATCAPSHRP